MDTTERVLYDYESDYESDYERERGKPLPGLIHSITQKNLVRALLPCEPPFIVASELTLDLDDGGCVTPDISVLAARSYSYADEEARVTEPPVLTVEILSATQSPQDLVRKIVRLLRAGVRSAWLVVPPLKTVTVFLGFDAAGEPQSTTYEVGETLRDEATGVEVALADVFAPPPTSEAP